LQLVHKRAGNTLGTTGIGKDFLSRTVAQQLRERMDKWDYMKLRSFCTTKEMASKLKRPQSGRKSLPAIHQTGLITRIYRELKKLNSPKMNELIKKWATELNRMFSKTSKWPKIHMKKCSPSLDIKEMQIKITLRFHLIPVRIAIIKNTTNNKYWQGCGEKGTLIHCWWECRLVNHYGKQCGSSLKN
jgi:hypothetical protein